MTRAGANAVVAVTGLISSFLLRSIDYIYSFILAVPFHSVSFALFLRTPTPSLLFAQSALYYNALSLCGFASPNSR